MTSEHQSQQRSVSGNRSMPSDPSSDQSIEQRRSKAVVQLQKLGERNGVGILDGKEDLGPEPGDLESIIGGFKAGTTMMIAGRPGTGKSQALLSLAASVAAGIDLFGLHVNANGFMMPVTEGPAVILSLEDPQTVMRKRRWRLITALRCAAAQRQALGQRGVEITNEIVDKVRKNLWIVSIAGTGNTLIAKGPAGIPIKTRFFEDLWEILIELRPALIGYDTFRRAKGPFKELDEDHITMVLSIWEELAARTNSLAVIVHHLTKAAEDSDPEDMFAASGSGAIQGFLRGQVNMARLFDPEGKVIKDFAQYVPSKNNYDELSPSVSVKQRQSFVVTELPRSPASTSKANSSGRGGTGRSAKSGPGLPGGGA